MQPHGGTVTVTGACYKAIVYRDGWWQNIGLANDHACLTGDRVINTKSGDLLVVWSASGPLTFNSPHAPINTVEKCESFGTPPDNDQLAFSVKTPGWFSVGTTTAHPNYTLPTACGSTVYGIVYGE